MHNLIPIIGYLIKHPELINIIGIKFLKLWFIFSVFVCFGHGECESVVAVCYGIVDTLTEMWNWSWLIHLLISYNIDRKYKSIVMLMISK